MQRRELRPTRELLTLLHHLNDVVGLSARYVFQHQLTPSQLLQTPQSDLLLVLPELCGFVDFLLPVRGSKSATTDASDPTPASTLVIRTFRHPDAQWLSRGARQSGVSALLCQQLVRLARLSDATEGDGAHYAAPELVLNVLLDALLSPCSQRLGRPPEACRWTPSQPKPRFHAMTCFPVWSSLLPFAAMMGLKYPETFQKVLEQHRRPDKRRVRVNCEFAQVTGIWRLVEEMNKGDKQNRQEATHVMISLLRFATDKLLYRSKEEGAHLDDQLLEKFFTGVQGFAFKSGRAHEVLKSAIFGALEEALMAPASRAGDVVPLRIAVFTAAGCMIVKDLAAHVTSMLLKPLKEAATSSRELQDPLLVFLIGFCAHVELVPIASVLELLELLVDFYQAELQADVDAEAQRRRQLDLVFYIVYVAHHRAQDVDKLRHDVSSDAAAVLKLFSQFQIRLCSEIKFEDFYVAAPVHWTADVWKHWVFLSDEEVNTFVSEAHENDADTEQEFKERVVGWKALTEDLGFRSSSLAQFKQMSILLKPHLISSKSLAETIEENGLAMHARKRRRTGQTSKKHVDPDLLERSFDVLHLPDVMERVCSFMSAKRLCRMALVCRAFAELSHRASLWRPLYIGLGKTQGALPPAPVECGHGDSYDHNWRQLYQTRWPVLRKLRRMQRRAIQARPSAEQSDTEASGASSANTFVPQICSYCGCNQLLKSAADQAHHKVQHESLTCAAPSCRASFTSKSKFRQHRTQHPTEKTRPRDAGRLLCGFKDCNKTYASAKRMATHRQKAGHPL